MRRLIFVLCAFSLCLADENGYVAHKRSRTDQTSEPDASFVVGTLYDDEIATKGKLYSSGIEIDATEATCTDSDCARSCWEVITNPYCMVTSSWCQGGGCHCIWFCATTGDGKQHAPKELFVVPDWTY
jgi:hypothetical protein